ncbi:MAG: hypothetical protein P8M34_14210 [Saprospiraceae bacterium]|nr:hypothetical protein [Saprospiraceae bacterium]|tara:strand:+ start:420 stop:740 length:321 start_codon:yes stop_codon:yes gene_type:complete
MKRVLLFVIGLLFLSGCDLQQPLNDDDIVFIGSWSSDEFYLEIGANGYGFCQKRNRYPIEGRVNITRNKIKFRGEGGKKDFDIDADPFIDQGDVMMILDGEYFYLH